MRKIISLVFCGILGVMFALNVLASDAPFVVDNADLLNSAEESKLERKLSVLSEELCCDIVVLTEQSIIGSAESYADDFFDYNGYGRGANYDGILLLVAMDEGEWHVSGCGICDSGFNDDAFDFICENIVDDLQAEEYYECFETFADRSSEVISVVREGSEFKESYDFFICLGVSLAVAFIIALIVTSVMKGQLNSVRSKGEASDYIKQNSFELTDSREYYLYRQVLRTKKVKTQGTGSHTSSSGRSHSGRGGRF